MVKDFRVVGSRVWGWRVQVPKYLSFKGIHGGYVGM